MKKNYLILFLLGFFTVTYAQIAQRGIPFVKNYLPTDYNGESQNWAIAQDDRGVMYFGNTKGILEFDGTYWNLIDPVNIYEAKKHPDGTIYIAGGSNFGYLKPNNKGEIKFVSFTNLLPDSINELKSFYSIAFANNKVYFSEQANRIYAYHNNTIR